MIEILRLLNTKIYHGSAYLWVALFKKIKNSIRIIGIKWIESLSWLTRFIPLLTSCASVAQKQLYWGLCQHTANYYDEKCDFLVTCICLPIHIQHFKSCSLNLLAYVPVKTSFISSQDILKMNHFPQFVA